MTPPPPLPQATRVARALRRAGDDGITQLDFDPPAIDGGAPIRRLASRINELREAGWDIESRKRPDKMVSYVLVSAPDLRVVTPADVARDGLAEDEVLRLSIDAPRPASPYDPYGDAA